MLGSSLDGKKLISSTPGLAKVQWHRVGWVDGCLCLVLHTVFLSVSSWKDAPAFVPDLVRIFFSQPRLWLTVIWLGQACPQTPIVCQMAQSRYNGCRLLVEAATSFRLLDLEYVSGAVSCPCTGEDTFTSLPECPSRLCQVGPQGFPRDQLKQLTQTS